MPLDPEPLPVELSLPPPLLPLVPLPPLAPPDMPLDEAPEAPELGADESLLPAPLEDGLAPELPDVSAGFFFDAFECFFACLCL